MSDGSRSEPIWKKIKFNEPYKKATDKFQAEIINRSDFNPKSLFQFSLFMAKALLQMFEDVEEHFGLEGQKVCNNALIKIGRDIAEQTFKNAEIPEEISDIELISFIATEINTVFWASVEDPKIINNEKCEFDILWCPVQDMYKPFDCRIQRYLVEGILEYLRELKPGIDFNLEFLSTIPAGAKTCKFQMIKKKPGEQDKWKLYSELLEKRALKRFKSKKNQKNKNE